MSRIQLLFPLLPLLCWLALVAALARRRGSPGWYHVILTASVAWGVLLTAATELLSLVCGLDAPRLALFWGGALVFLTAAARRGGGPWFSRPDWRPSIASAVIIGGILLIGAATLLTCVTAPPNTWDSMTYHMARVAHWVQNRSVAHYPTSILRQIYLNPWAEFALMHFQILSGGDSWANLVQWFSMAGSVVGSYALAVRLGSGITGGLLAAAVCASIPMGILQASSTQNDLVASFWLIAFAYFGLRWRERTSWESSAIAGAAFGLAVLTKAIAFVVAAPLALWFLAQGLSRHHREFLRSAGVVALVVLALNAGHFTRNANLFGNPLGTTIDGPFRYTNETFTPAVVISNLVRNAAVQLPTTEPKVAAVTQGIVVAVHDAIGADLNDPRSTWPGSVFKVPALHHHEDFAGNPWHFLLAVVTAAALLVHPVLRRNREARWLLFSAAVGLVLFCAILKWQPWHSRLLLPFFVLAAPLGGYVLVKAIPRWAAYCATVALLSCAMPYALNNESRPLLGKDSILVASRENLYFRNRPQIEGDYRRGAGDIAAQSCRDIGLVIGMETWEYPLWALLGSQGAEMRIEHVRIENVSRTLALQVFRPCLIVTIDNEGRFSIERTSGEPVAD